jgi:hypothetical protein
MLFDRYQKRNNSTILINAFTSDGASKFDFEPNILTIEHVLPQTVSPGSEWEKTWSDISVQIKLY